MIANLPYNEAVASLVPSGAYTGELIRTLMGTAGSALEDFHAIGTSPEFVFLQIGQIWQPWLQGSVLEPSLWVPWDLPWRKR